MAFNVGIVILSDTCFKDKSQDKTIPALQGSISAFNTQQASDNQYTITRTTILPDKEDEIQNIISSWTKLSADGKSQLDLILTCGGTGFTQHDVTPEAIKPLLQKEAPGIVHAMMSSSLQKTPFAIMSRPVAGVINKSLVITLPGSPRGAKENLESIIKTLPHALLQIGNKDARGLHQKLNRTLNDASPGGVPLLESGSGHGGQHHHHHDHDHNHGHSHGNGIDKVTGRIGCGIARHKLISNDLDAPVTQRARDSPYPIISLEESFSLIKQHTPEPTVIEMSITDPLLTGSYVADDYYAPKMVPNFRASIVDGYAVVSSDGSGTYPVVSVSHASSLSKESHLQPGAIARVTTGAPVPQGADAVVMVEESELISMTDDKSEEKEVKILAVGVQPNDNIREIGSDLKKGELILRKGDKISESGGEVGLLASVGINTVKVYRKPTIGVLSTGDELRDVSNSSDGQLRYGEIYDSNRPTLISTICNTGYQSVDFGIASDQPDSLAELLKQALEKSDYLITTGGVSMGEKDLLKPTIERVLGGVIHFGRVRMKPGKPTTFATVEYNGKSKVIFALPGNPASASVCYHLFVLPSLMKFQGAPLRSNGSLPGFPRISVKLSSDCKLDPKRPEFQRVVISQNLISGDIIAESTGFQRSSNIGSFKGANGFVCLPASCDIGGLKFLKRGESVEAILIGLLAFSE
ncbi:unnamed protein product [Ambrosiozyma monospora]|uniref:Unnamed protein product n=1 Tax=Ambrosiozyma monospora TaxID=43982 RepID=A0A9W6YPJ8_AMBMO|nr:unnamed protein product [Ambrosiozyma monospora]